MSIVNCSEFTRIPLVLRRFSRGWRLAWSLVAACLMLAVQAMAQVCPAPWATAQNVYAMVELDGNGQGSAGGVTQTVNQHAVVVGKMAAVGQCVWEAIPLVGFGQVKSNGNVNDKVVTQNDTMQWIANGAGDPMWDSMTFQIMPSSGQYSLGATGAIPGTFSSSSGTVNEDIIWGSTFADGGVSEQGKPFPTGAPFLLGTDSYQLPPFDNAQGNPGTINANWNVLWMLSPTPDLDCDDCKHGEKRGSSISVSSQSLAEDIAIRGTGMALHYESGRAVGRAGADVVAVRDALSLGGWTLNVHHVMEPVLSMYCAGGGCTPYSVVPKALFLGDGTYRKSADVQASLAVGSTVQLTSEDGSEVYVFDGVTGVHTQTLLPMTGAVLYTFGYDANGLLITVTDGSSNVTTIKRDSKGHPTAIVSPYGQTTTIAVDANGYLSQVTDPMGNAIKLTTSSLGLLTSFKDAKGNLYSFQYDGNGFLTKDSDPAGGIINLALAGNTSSYSVMETTAQGRSNSNQVAFSNTASSTTQQFTNFWSNGLQATETDTQETGQLTESAVMPNGQSYSKTFGPDPRWGIQIPIATSESVTRGSLTMNITRSRAVNLANPADPFSLTTQTETETINGRVYSSVFTAATKAVVDTTPVKRKTTTVLDALERISSVDLPWASPTSFTYDSRGRLSTVTQGTRQSSLTYDSNGNLASFTDPLNLTRSFTYDADGRQLTTTLEDGRVINYSYDANGNLSSVTPPGASAHSFSYSAVDLPTAYTPPPVSGGGATTYSFSADRQVTKLTRPDGEVVNYNYDGAGRLSSLVSPSSTINFTYASGTGALSSASISGGEALSYSYNGPLPTGSSLTGTVSGSVAAVFDNNFWVTSTTINGGNSVAFTYDKDGLISKAGAITLKHNLKTGLYTGSTLGTAKDTFTYNAFGESTAHTAKHGSAILYKAAYTRDDIGRVAGLKDTIGGSTTSYTYVFDKAGRLTSVKKGTSTMSSYTYDSNSNRLSATTSSGTVNATYDAQDRMLTYGNASFSYSGNGELASKSSGSQLTTYQYDVYGNLTAATLPNGTQIGYIVDPEGERVGKKVNGVVVEGFLYEGRRLVAQLDGNNNLVSQFVYGSGSTSPDYMLNGGATYRIFSDHLGSPRLVVDSATGQIAQRIDYDEFGNVLNDTNPGFQPFGFAGGMYDQDTKLVRFGARDYDPTTGRWTAKDPTGFSGGDTNLYGYVLSDPINMVDPAGLEGQCICPDNVWNFGWGFVDRAHEIVLGPVIWPIAATQAVAGYAVGANTFGHAVRMGISAATGTPSSVDSNSTAFLGGVIGADVLAGLASGRAGSAAELQAAAKAGRAAMAERMASKAESVANMNKVRDAANLRDVARAETAADRMKVCNPNKGRVIGQQSKARAGGAIK